MSEKRDSDMDIPDKEEIITKLRLEMSEQDKNVMDNIYSTATFNNPTFCLSKDQSLSLVWELVNIVTNTIVGENVQCYRLKKLTRVNDVAFRTSIAVKCEKPRGVDRYFTTNIQTPEKL